MTRIQILCLFGFATLAGCGGGNPSDQNAAIKGGANQGGANAAASCTPAASAGAPGCDPLDTKKTTICHVPPGNPANAHTLCVGNEAVPAHLAHGDALGVCVTICPPDDGGAPGDSSGDGGGSPGTPPDTSPDLSQPASPPGPIG